MIKHNDANLLAMIKGRPVPKQRPKLGRNLQWIDHPDAHLPTLQKKLAQMAVSATGGVAGILPLAAGLVFSVAAGASVNSTVVPGLSLGKTGVITVQLQLGGVTLPFPSNVVPTWSSTDPNAYLTPSSDGTTCGLSLFAGEQLNLSTITVTAVMPSGTVISQPISVPVIDPTKLVAPAPTTYLEYATICRPISGDAYGNFVCSDCVEAAVGNNILQVTAMLGKQITPDTPTIEGMYGGITGWPATGDNGTLGNQGCSWWMNHKITGTSCLAYSAISKVYGRQFGSAPGSYTYFGQVVPQNMMNGMFYFGGIHAEFSIPESVFNESVWEALANDGGYAGEHQVFCHSYSITGYDATGWPIGYVYFRSWYGEMAMSWAFVKKYCNGFYATIVDAMFGANGLTPGGFSFSDLTTIMPNLGINITPGTPYVPPTMPIAT